MIHRSAKIISLFLALLLAAIGCSSPWTSSRTGEWERPPGDSRKLHELFDSYFEEHLRLHPVFATSISDHRYDDQLGDGISEAHRERQRLLMARALDDLSKFERDSFEAKDQLSYDLFKRQLSLGLEGLKFQQHLIPVQQLSSTPIEFPLLGSGSGIHPFRTVRDYENFLKRIAGFQAWVETAIANMQRGIELGIVQPKVVMERTLLPQLEAMLPLDVKQSIFYQPVRQMPSSFSEAEKTRITTEYKQAIEGRIIPTYTKLHAFIKEHYLPKSRASVGLSELTGGNEWYAHLVRVHTTTDLAPDEIFQLGQNEIERITGEIDKLKENVNFQGNSAEFAKYLSANAPNYTTKEELIRAYEKIRAQVTPQLVTLFGQIPKALYEIRPIEEFRERSAPSQYRSASPDGSRPGIFYINAAGIKASPRRPSESLFLHEAVPGHHFQISLSREQESLPRFRRFGSYTAFVEGWALYAESLGSELGLYTKPHQHISRLNSELFRAARLVVDVGLHRKGWTREHAVRFLMDNTLTSESGAALEIDRYIAIPGQALAYKIGQLKISAIRSKAETILGSEFDIRAFHDELLKDGALPLDLLEAKMAAWIERQSR